MTFQKQINIHLKVFLPGLMSLLLNWLHHSVYEDYLHLFPVNSSRRNAASRPLYVAKTQILFLGLSRCRFAAKNESRSVADLMDAAAEKRVLSISGSVTQLKRQKMERWC